MHTNQVLPVSLALEQERKSQMVSMETLNEKREQLHQVLQSHSIAFQLHVVVLEVVFSTGPARQRHGLWEWCQKKRGKKEPSTPTEVGVALLAGSSMNR
jgi:hypothetical protein